MCSPQDNLTHAECQYCGAAFSYVRVRKHRKYCSKKCRERSVGKAKRARRGINVGAGMRRRAPSKCQHCLKEFIPKASNRRKYCSRDCAHEAKRAARYCFVRFPSCGNCGVVFATNNSQRNYCCVKCRSASSYARHGRSSPVDKKGVCKNCGDTFDIPATKGRPPSFCSSECRAEIQGGKRYKHEAGSECQQCGTAFVRERGGSPFCSDECLRKHNRPEKVIADEQKSGASGGYHKVPTKHKPCYVCGEWFSTNMTHQKTCSDYCSNQHRHKHYNVRRARKLSVEYEAVAPIEILERDGWICQICGRDTPKSKRGVGDHDSPEVDHITPLARGGSHTRENMQCACRECNQRKGARYVA